MSFDRYVSRSGAIAKDGIAISRLGQTGRNIEVVDLRRPSDDMRPGLDFRRRLLNHE